MQVKTRSIDQIIEEQVRKWQMLKTEKAEAQQAVSVITVSREPGSGGKLIARGVAEKLGYECVDREVFLEASGDYNLPEIKLIRAIHDAPSILERLGHSKEKYIAKFQATFLRHMKKNNVVYHGLAGQYFIQNVPHVFKVRIIADISGENTSERIEGIYVLHSFFGNDNALSFTRFILR